MSRTRPRAGAKYLVRWIDVCKLKRSREGLVSPTFNAKAKLYTSLDQQPQFIEINNTVQFDSGPWNDVFMLLP